MVAVPVVIPVIVPVLSIIAVAVSAEYHVPPVAASLNVIESPAQRVVTPVIAAGKGLIVIPADKAHPDGSV